jgi:MFS family permease
MGQGIATPVIPIYAQSFGVSFEMAALVVILNSLGGLAATVPVGWMVDRFGRRPVLLAGPIITALTSFATAFAPTFGILLACRFLNGGAQQMWQISRLTMIIDTGRDRERGRLITWMSQVTTFSGLFSPAIGGFIATYWGVQLPFIIYGCLAIVAIIPSFRLAQETDPNRRRAAARGTDLERVPWREAIAGMLNPQMLAFFAAQFLANFTRGINYGGLLNLYAAYTYGVGPGTIGLLASANSFIQLPLGFTTGYIMDRWGRKRTIVPGFSLLAIAMIFMTSTALFHMPFEVFVASYLAVTFSQGITAGNMQVMGSDLAPLRGRGQWMAVWRFIAQAGGQLSPTMFAVVSALFSYVGAFGLVGFSSFAVAMLVGLCIRETVGRQRQGDEEPAAVATQPTAART